MFCVPVMRTTCLVHLFLIIIIYFFFMARLPQVDQELLIFGAPRSHSDTPHSVGLLWTSDQPDAETST
jgi:hypothetical protein